MNAYASPDLAGNTLFPVGSGDPTGTKKQQIEALKVKVEMLESNR